MRSAAAALVVLAALAREAHAGGADRRAVIEADAASDACLIAGLFGSRALLATGFGGYLFGGPIAHAGYGEWDRAGASLGLRVATPLAGVGLGYGLGRLGANGTDDRAEAGAAIGLVVGFLAAQVLDWTLVSEGAHDPDPAARMITIGGAF